MYIASVMLFSGVTFIIQFFGDIYKAARCSSKTVILSGNQHKMGSFQKCIFLVLCGLRLIHGIAVFSVAEPEVSSYFPFLKSQVGQILTQYSTTNLRTTPSTLTLIPALLFLSALGIHATIWLPGVVSRKKRLLPSTRKLCALLCLPEHLYAARREQLSSHRTVVVIATLILSARAILARRLPRDTRSPRRRSRRGTPILRHGTGVTSSRLVARFVLARANPQCQLQSVMQCVVPTCLEQHVPSCGPRLPL